MSLSLCWNIVGQFFVRLAQISAPSLGGGLMTTEVRICELIHQIRVLAVLRIVYQCFDVHHFLLLLKLLGHEYEILSNIIENFFIMHRFA